MIKEKIPLRSLKKILIIRRNGLGDLLCTIPLLHFLQKQAPNAKVTLVVGERNSILLPYIPFVDRSILFKEGGNKYLNALKVALKLNKERFDLALSAKASPMKLMNFFLRFIRAKNKVAYVNPNSPTRALTHPVYWQQSTHQTSHQALKVLHLIDPTLKEIPQEYYPRITLPKNSHFKEQWENHPFFRNSDPTLILSASNTLATNALSEEKYSRIVNCHLLKYRFKVLIVGLKSDQRRGESLAAKIKAPVLFHVPATFDEFLYLLNCGDFCFVSDGGTAHLTAALAKRAVYYFGSVSPQQWAPLSSQAALLFNPTHVEQIPDDDFLTALETVWKIKS
jgi:ADP-heptose:LPS heptosyltransferase